MLDLRDRGWAAFPLTSIFIIKSGKRLTKSEMKSGVRPFIGATEANNGITNFVSNTNASLDSNVLGVNYNGSVVETFYHPYECIFSDDVKRFELKKGHQGNRLVYLFLKTVIMQQKPKYAYGYKFNEQRMNKQVVLLPVTKNVKPDWQFMEDYIREREQMLIDRYVTHVGKMEKIEKKQDATFIEQEWKPFCFSEIFTSIQRGKRLKTDDHISGQVPYVSSSAANNGVDGFISNDQGVRKFEHCLTVANSGSVGRAFYHKYSFVASDHVTQLKNPELNQYIYLFLAPLVSRLAEKYSFNREINDSRINKEILLLPVTDDGKPDWDYMEQYAKVIMYRLMTTYSDYLEKRATN